MYKSQSQENTFLSISSLYIHITEIPYKYIVMTKLMF